MKCSKCGTEIDGKNPFCPGCGCKIENDLNNQNNSSTMNQNVSLDLNNQNNSVAMNQNVSPNLNNQNNSSTMNQNVSSNLNNQNNNVAMNQNLNPNMNYSQNNNSNMNYNQNKNSAFGTISILLGVASIVLGFLYPIIGLIVGIVGIVLASMYFKQTNSKTAGKALSIVGVVLSVLGTILKVLLVVGITFLTNIFNGINKEDVQVGDKPSDNTTVESSEVATTLTCTYKGTAIEETYTTKFDKNDNLVGYTEKIKAQNGIIQECFCFNEGSSLEINNIDLSDSKYRCNSCSNVKPYDSSKLSQGESMILFGKMADLIIIKELKGTSGFNGSYTIGSNTTDYTIDVDFSKLSSKGKEILSIEDYEGYSSSELKEVLTSYGYTCK